MCFEWSRVWTHRRKQELQQLQCKTLLSKNEERDELRTHSETVLQKKKKTNNATLTRLNYF